MATPLQGSSLLLSTLSLAPIFLLNTEPRVVLFQHRYRGTYLFPPHWENKCCVEKARPSRQVITTVQCFSSDTSQLLSFNSHVCICKPCFKRWQGLSPSSCWSTPSVLPVVSLFTVPLTLQALLPSPCLSVTAGCNHAGDAMRGNVPGKLGVSTLLESNTGRTVAERF